MLPKDDVPSRLVHLRELAGEISARELSLLLGLAAGTISLIESGVRSGRDCVETIAVGLDISLDWLVRGIGAAPSERRVRAAVDAARARAAEPQAKTPIAKVG